MYNERSRVYSDLCGGFPIQSSRGNNYIIVAYHYDADTILLHTVKNLNTASLVEGWKVLLKQITTPRVKAMNWILDNECSNELIVAITKADIKYQLVPPFHTEQVLLNRLYKILSYISKLDFHLLMQIF